jgi:N-acetylglutamate synthase/N-acetylornithine aminotransferase
MLRGTVVRHEVEQKPDAACMQLRHQLVKDTEGAEQRIDIAVVGNIVAKIEHGRRIDRA